MSALDPAISGSATAEGPTDGQAKGPAEGPAEGTAERTTEGTAVQGSPAENPDLARIVDSFPGVDRSVVLADEHRSDGRRSWTAYVLPRRNEAVTDDGAALEQSYVEEWRGVFDHVYGASAPGDATFDTRGWQSSYTGAEVDDADMRAWTDDTVERIQALGGRRLLEIGCGTGLLLHRLHADAERYTASDITAGAMTRIRDAFGGTLPEGVELFQAPADDLSPVPPGSVDGVILNSVSQYLPDEPYLDRVLRQAVDVLDDGGFLFVGDVRSAALNRAFAAGIELARAPGGAPAEKVQTLAERRCGMGTELLVDPGYFTDLAAALPRVAHVAVLPKRGRSDTEMTRYRYDVVIRLDRIPGGAAPAIEWTPWAERRPDAAEVRRILVEERPESLGLLDVPNSRTAADHAAAELLARPDGPATAEEALKAARAAVGRTVDPEDLFALGDELPYAVRLSWARSQPDGGYDVAIVRSAPDGGPAPEPRFPSEPAPPRRHVNAPWFSRVEHLNLAKLRAHVRERLDGQEMPGRFVVLESLPFAADGSVDRDALRTIHWA
ncbi:methyltransferase [Streptomyces sp. NPDC051907]|uniref:methyltransferase n=1 Tax=Streptomyces sp. NPDC051907 TaxID=3155284 RepID=UPI00341C7307